LIKGSDSNVEVKLYNFDTNGTTTLH